MNECEKELLFAIDDTPESIPKITSNNELAEFEREIKFEGCPTKILIDAGASVNILNLQTLRKIENFTKIRFKIIPTHTRLVSYGMNNTNLHIKGTTTLLVEANNRCEMIHIFIVEGNHRNLLSGHTAIIELKLKELTKL